jgi:(1->4)-alpha-D-glucan 1-alpha-D-glucosylmutase
MYATQERPAQTKRLPNTQALEQLLRQRRRIPVTTYRLQMHAEFTFRDAAAVVPYLAQLGVTDCYCSPYMQARPGSKHGYDITDHSRLNPELGSEADYRAFVELLADRHMGQVLDFVPNHMGVDPVHNPWWRDVLENGRASAYARYFDIDWDPVKPELRGKVLLPVLGGSYGNVLDKGELQLAFEDGVFVLRYFERNFPLDPHEFPRILRTNLDALKADLPPEDPNLQEYLSVLTQLDHLPGANETAPERVAERRREREVARERLARLVNQSPRIRQHIDALLQLYNGQPGNPKSFEPLHELLEVQPYRLAYWRTAVHEINYRRFFDINDLAGLRMEDPAVFRSTHARVLDLIRHGRVTGLRLDHLDGLFDPAGYLEMLQEAILEELAAAAFSPPETGRDEWRDALRAWRAGERRRDPGGLADRPFYVVAEKILSPGETLPESWPCYGTSGYDFLNELNDLFVDGKKLKHLKQIYRRFTGQTTPFPELVYECKRLITRTSMSSELTVLADALNRISESDRHLRDYTLASLRVALREVVSCFPVYRTYLNASGATETDKKMIDIALNRARRRSRAMDVSVFGFVRQALLPKPGGELTEEDYRARLDFAMKLQQYTGPVQAKGVEDTAFYRHNVLLSVNEVGGDPQHAGGPPERFHEKSRRRHEKWSYAMLATTTHDTKRGEDARARLNVLSEMPDEWGKHLAAWARLNAGQRTEVDGEPAPDRNDECFYYQTLLGAWPAETGDSVPATAPEAFVKRVREAMRKATKEAKVHTSWISSDEAYDAAMARFVDRTLTGPRAGRFLAAFLPFQRRIARLGMINSLAQVVLKVASPGVPDFYQGTELWDLSMVDPDNRGPIDYALRTRLLNELEPVLAGQGAGRVEAVTNLLRHWEDGRIKQFLTAAGMRLRARLPRVFLEGDYVPLQVAGARADHVVAFARLCDEDSVVAVVPRLAAGLLSGETLLPIGPDVWQNTVVLLPENLATRRYTDAFTGEGITSEQNGRAGIPVSKVLRSCPVALLVWQGSVSS